MAAVEPPAEPTPNEDVRRDEDEAPIDLSAFDKIKFKPNSGRYVFMPKTDLGESPDE